MTRLLERAKPDPIPDPDSEWSDDERRRKSFYLCGLAPFARRLDRPALGQPELKDASPVATHRQADQSFSKCVAATKRRFAIHRNIA
jgi:hypothetical protein